MLLLSLPDELGRIILVEWLTPLSWNALDSSLCSRKWRNQFLSFVNGLTFRRKAGITGRFIQWVINRNLILVEVVVGRLFTAQNFGLLYSIPKEPITSLTITDEQCDFTSFVNMLCNLTSLSSPASSLDFDSLNASLLSQLVYLDITNRSTNISKKVSAISEYCRSLKTLRCSFDYQVGVCAIIEANPQLEVIDTSMSKQTLEFLSIHCCNTLKSVHARGVFDYNSITFLLSKCPHLRDIELTGRLGCVWRKNETFEIVDTSFDYDGWDDLSIYLHKLRTVKFNCRLSFNLNLVQLIDQNATTLNSFSLKCDYVAEEDLKHLICSCSSLKSFYLSVFDTSINYGSLFSAPNSSLESLELVGGEFQAVEDVDVLQILASSKRLTALSIVDVWCSVDELFHVVLAVEQYENLQRSPLKVTVSVHVDSKARWGFVYDGYIFSGKLWDNCLKGRREAERRCSELAVELERQKNEVEAYKSLYGPLPVL